MESLFFFGDPMRQLDLDVGVKQFSGALMILNRHQHPHHLKSTLCVSGHFLIFRGV